MYRTDKIKAAVALCLALSLAMLLAACASGRPTHEYTDNEDVVIESISHEMTGPFMTVYAVLRADDPDEVIDTVYRLDFYDEKGRLLESTKWRPIQVKGGAPYHIKESSTKPGAKDYTLVISNDAS